MPKNRASLRQEFAKKAMHLQQSQQSAEQTAELKTLQRLLVTAYNSLIRFLSENTSKVSVTNQLKEIKTPDIDKVVVAIGKLNRDLLTSKTDLKPIVIILNAIQKELTKIPKEQAKFEQKDAFKVTNLSEIKFDTSTLEKTITKELRKLDIKPEAPIVNVEKPDFTPIKTLFNDILQQLKKNKPERLTELKVTNLGDIEPTDTSKIEKKLDDSNKYLKEITEKRFGGGGGGGGNGTPYVDAEGKPVNIIKGFDPGANLTITKTVVGNVTTYVKTDGTKTQTIVINNDTNVITKVWT